MSPDTFLHVSAEHGESVEKGLRPLLHAKDFLLLQEHLLVPLRIVVLGEYPDEVVVLIYWKNKQKIWDYFFVVKFTSWCVFCIYKISYQILFPLSMCSYVKSFFMKKVSKYHSLTERRDKLLIYNKIEEWYFDTFSRKKHTHAQAIIFNTSFILSSR